MISVIMGIYNPSDPETLEQAINSILIQTYQDFEFLIYDDGSEKEKAVVLEQLVKKDARIRLLRGETNKGLAHALNECLAIAKGEYIARMDGDDICAPERLWKQKEFLDHHSEYAFVGCSARLFDEEGIWGCRKMVERPTKREIIKYSPYIHPSVMFRKNRLKEVGGYLEAKETRRCEDYELFMRLYSKGFYGYNLEEALFFYHESRAHYDKRNFTQRIAEMKIRYRGFQAMGVLNMKTILYVLKPVVMLFLPEKIRNTIRNKNRKYTKYEHKKRRQL